MSERILSLFDTPLRQMFLVIGLTVVALVVLFFLKRLAIRFAKRTDTELDEYVVSRLYRPVGVSILVFGCFRAMEVGRPDSTPPSWLYASFMSIVVLYWTLAAYRISNALLQSSASPLRKGMLTQRSLPFFQMLTTGAIGAIGVYFLFLCWDLDLTAWLASAGIIGVAVGFAAQDSLANVFAGVSIMADAPYKLGDHLLLESGERGEVTDIGLRSTRLRTRGDIQIVVPNSIMAETKIVNESGGPRKPHRISLVLGVAYGTDVDAMKDIVIAECAEVENVLKHPAPNVLFTSFGDSALLFDVLVSIHDSSQRAFVLDGMHMRIYKRLAKEGIEIPFPQRSIHMKQD